jgi:hypothetical protein
MQNQASAVHRRRRPYLAAVAWSGAVLVLALAGSAHAQVNRPARGQFEGIEVQSLDGAGNNRANPDIGSVGTRYARVTTARYADGIGEPIKGPNARYVSNRVFNDTGQNLFSESRVSQWGFVWGQFLDHTFGLRAAPGVGDAPDPSSRNIPFDGGDPLESFTNVNRDIPFTRSSVAEGTGEDSPREQVNTVSSYIDAWVVYGGTEERLEWLREGPVDGDLGNNDATLLLPRGHLPRRDVRGDVDAAPAMDVDGALRGRPDHAVVAGDVRANENVALQATHTLFAREHNRIVSLLPERLSAEERFQIARRVVIAEQQFITYTEFLPALGIRLPAYRGYDATVDPTLTNEFATVGYRAHSMIHGEFELEADAGRYSAGDRAKLAKAGVEVADVPATGDVELAVPLNVAFFNPDLLPLLQVGPMLHAIGLESEYRNDEQIDNQLRSVLFQIPVPGNTGCLDGTSLPECFRGVVDLGAVDIERGRDHGMPSYNQLRAAYGLAPKRTFTAITGERSERFPADPQLTPGAEIDDPDSIEFLELFDGDDAEVELGSEAGDTTAVRGARRTSLAARLKAIYSSPDNLDAFVGMVAEQHVAGAEFGELQHAIWTRQFRALRDGDRFFYLNDPGLSAIRSAFGIDHRHRLSELIALNTDVPASDLARNVFLVADEEPAPAPTRGTARAITPTFTLSVHPRR